MGVRGFIILGLMAAFFSGCGGCDDSPLSKICPNPVPCMVWQNDSSTRIVTGNVSTPGQCQAGITEYEPKTCAVSCVGYTGPSDEVCDGIDNDCDGTIDEGFDADRDGFTSCEGDCDDGSYGINPAAPETCNGIDDDCDGETDEDLVMTCWTGLPGANLGPNSRCREGYSECINGKWSACAEQVFKTKEICNGIDDDCDGVIDEPVFSSCGPRNTLGVCTHGDQVCSDDETYCVNATYSSPEVCDGLDNDCDGVADENLERLCQTACGVGEETCQMGEWVGCDAPQPAYELCDGIDNDCDGSVDEGCLCSLGEATVCRENVFDQATGDLINCGLGITLCSESGLWGPCYFFSIDAETCNDWDDDCDGVVDGMTEACGDPNLAGHGECRLGTRTCTAGMLGDCEGAVVPTDEVCDGLDNDCDDEVDEDLDPHARVDIVFAVDGSGSMCGVMNALLQGIGSYVADFQGTEHRFALVVFPGPGFQNPYELLTPGLVDITAFQSALSGLTCNYPGDEPSYDVAYDLASPSDPIGIGWRTGTSSAAYPYIILVADEQPQTWRALMQPGIANQMADCRVGECVPGDAYEIFVITPNIYWGGWDQITFNEPERLIELYPPDADRYTSILRDIFTNVCL